jgi:TolB-like protein/DNA-binding winged helix-turn-helix (wHTH) protein/Tfp pilus assembly protein PilF
MQLIGNEMFEFGPFLLDPIERILSRQGTPVSLTPKAFEILLCLVRNPGRMVTKNELLRQIWPDTFVEEVNLAVNISAIRKALGESPQDSRFITTVPGRGYRFVAEVRILSIQNGDGNWSRAAGHAAGAENSKDRGIIPKVENGSAALGDRPAADLVKRRPFTLAIPAALALLITAILASYGWREKQAKVSAPGSSSIAVLPFADLSPSQDQQYFIYGLTEQLINDLARVPGLKVVGRSSSFQFKDKNEDLRTVGRTLGVASVLEGSVSREGDRVRIRAELVKTEDGFQLWSETYDRKIDDIFAVQDEIARAATRTLQLKLSGANSATRERVTNAQAYEAYLRAQYFTTRGRDKTDLDNALTYTERAIKLDPKYAPAWAVRSYILDTMGDVGLIEPDTAFRRAREDAERAIELDANGPSGYLALAWIQINRDWNWEGAELSLNKAAELQPGSASILRFRSFLAHSQGRLKEAIGFHEQAITLDPQFASSHSYLAFLLYSAGQYDKALVSAQKALELNPQKTYDHFTRGEIFLAQGRLEESLAEMKQEPGAYWRLPGEALVYHALGREQDSNAALTELITQYQQSMAFQIAEVYAYRGNADLAFQWLNRAYQQRDSGMRSLKIDPLLKSLHKDPRYSELLRKMRLMA